MFSSPLFSLVVHWSGNKAQKLDFDPDSSDSYLSSPPAPVAEFFRQLERYVSGKDVRFNLPFDMSGLSQFSLNIFQQLSKISSGQVISYSELARMAGKPKAARAVGRIMARNPFPIVIPCHRVVGSKGALTGFAGGLALKRRLLELEADSETKSA